MKLRHVLMIVGALWLTQAAGAGQEKKGPRLAVEPASFDFGRALQQKTLTKEFTVSNLGDELLVLAEVKTTCGCTAALPGETRLAPGARTPLSVTLRTGSYKGRLERRVLIRSNDARRPVTEVTVIATVVTPEP